MFKKKSHLPEDCDKSGYYILPTVITDLDDSSELMREEIFGPVACVTKFRDESEVIARANDNNYGLAATVWTQDISRAHRVARALETGYVNKIGELIWDRDRQKLKNYYYNY